MEANKRNQSARFAVSIVMVFMMCMTASSWIATQYFAHLLSYQPGLGEAVFNLSAGRKVYQPFSWFFWNLEWMNEGGVLRDYITRMQLVVIAGAFLSLAIGIFMTYRRSLVSENHDDLYGSARWATERDVEKMNLMSYERRGMKYKATGIYVGAFMTKDGLKVLRYNEPAHALCFAPTRSGKGRGLVLPTLLSYPHSTCTNDIKAENYELTSGFRHTAGSLVMRFDPTAVDQKSIDGKSKFNQAVRWNPLDEIRAYSDYDVMDAQNIAAAIADPDGEGMDDHWVSTSYELLTGLLLHVLYFERDKSLTGAATYLADPSFTDPEQMFNRMLTAEHDDKGVMGWTDSSGNATKTHPVVALAARAMLNKEEKERNSVLSTAKTKLGLYTEPIVARNVARSDFRINDLMNHDRPVSMYIVVPPSDKERLRPLIRLFLTFVIRRLASKMEFQDGESVKNYRHRLLLLIDELASLRKLDQLQDGLSYIAGYGITAYMFVQDTIQLKEAYGDKETITAGCQLRIAYAPNTLETAKDISDMTGAGTRKKQNISYSGSRLKVALGQMTVSEEYVERNLLTPNEAMKLPRDELLIFNTGHPAIRGKKLMYDKMPEFNRRAKIASPSRVSMSYLNDAGKLAGAWFMVLCERIAKSAEMDVIINCYEEFPAMDVVVKQEMVESERIIEIPYQLCSIGGGVVDRTLTVDDLQFRIKPAGDVSLFDPQEAYEVHFIVKDQGAYKNFSQVGFFRDLSVYEREVRRKVKDHFYELENRDGMPVDLRFDRMVPDGRYSGVVLMHTDHFVVLEKERGFVSLHRKVKIDRVPAKGEQVLIRYVGKKGAVS